MSDVPKTSAMDNDFLHRRVYIVKDYCENYDDLRGERINIGSAKKKLDQNAGKYGRGFFGGY